jgi:putative oligomerization/nucleic acid binding protein/phospholipase D-like protein
VVRHVGGFSSPVIEGKTMPILDFFWTMMIFFLWVIWIWLLITVFIDIFRDKSHSGWSKALWVVFLIFIPLLGVLVYLIVRGDDMHQRQIDHAVAMQKSQEKYIREVSGGSGSSNAEELTKLAELHKNGVLTDDEFAAQKAKLLA